MTVAHLANCAVGCERKKSIARSDISAAPIVNLSTVATKRKLMNGNFRFVWKEKMNKNIKFLVLLISRTCGKWQFHTHQERERKRGGLMPCVSVARFRLDLMPGERRTVWFLCSNSENLSGSLFVPVFVVYFFFGGGGNCRHDNVAG